MILDFGEDVREKRPKNSERGTIIYQAPELIELRKDTKFHGRYDKPVGVWGLGLYAFELLRYFHVGKDVILQPTIVIIRTMLD